MANIRLLIKLCLTTVMLMIMLISTDHQVHAGKRKIMMGMMLASAMRHSARENSILRVLIPIRVASEAWKKYGELAAANKYSHGHYHVHHGHYDYIDHFDEHHAHCHSD